MTLPTTPEGHPMREIVTMAAHTSVEAQQGVLDALRQQYGDRLRAVPEAPQSGEPLSVYMPWDNTYYEGRVRSVNTTDMDGHRATVGEMDPGEYSFTTTGRERITVQEGRLEVGFPVDGETSWAFYDAGQTVEIPANTEVVFNVRNSTVKYFCQYLDESPAA